MLNPRFLVGKEIGKFQKEGNGIHLFRSTFFRIFDLSDLKTHCRFDTLSENNNWKVPFCPIAFTQGLSRTVSIEK